MDENRKRFGICLGVLAAALGIGAAGLAPAQAFAASPAAAPLVRIDLTVYPSDYTGLTAWATHYGHKMNLRGDVAKLAGLSHGKDVDVTGVLYVNKTGLKIFYAVIPGRADLMARADSEFELYWFFPHGAPPSLIYADKRGPKKIESSTYDEEYRSWLGVLVIKMRACSADATACPSDR